MTMTLKPLVWTPRRVIEVASEAFDVNESALMGRDRFHPLEQYRQVAYAAVKRFCGLSYLKTAEFFRRDHTSVRYSILKVESDPDLSHLYGLLAERLLTEGVG